MDRLVFIIVQRMNGIVVLLLMVFHSGAGSRSSRMRGRGNQRIGAATKDERTVDSKDSPTTTSKESTT